MPRTILCRLLLLLLLASSWCAAQAEAEPTATNVVGRLLLLENSTMSLKAAKATLIIGPLTRTNGVFVGNFKMKVFPYFFKNDWGRLSIKASDEDMAAFEQGKTVAVTGIATSEKNGSVRPIEIKATPQDRDHGTVCLCFEAAKQKMTFSPAYHFADKPKEEAKAKGETGRGR